MKARLIISYFLQSTKVIGRRVAKGLSFLLQHLTDSFPDMPGFLPIPLWNMGSQSSRALGEKIHELSLLQDQYTIPFVVETDVVEMFYEIPRQAIPEAVRFVCEFVISKVRKRRLFWAVHHQLTEVTWGHHDPRYYSNFSTASLLEYISFEIDDNKFFFGVDNNGKKVLLVQKLGVPIGGMLSAQLADCYCVWRTYFSSLLPRSVYLCYCVFSFRYRDNILFLVLLDGFGVDGGVWIDFFEGETCPFCEQQFSEPINHHCVCADVGKRFSLWAEFLLRLPIQLENMGQSVPSMGRQFLCSDTGFSFYPINRVKENEESFVPIPRCRFLFYSDLPRKRLAIPQLLKTMFVLYCLLSSGAREFWYGWSALLRELISVRKWKEQKTFHTAAVVLSKVFKDNITEVYHKIVCVNSHYLHAHKPRDFFRLYDTCPFCPYRSFPLPINPPARAHPKTGIG